MKKLMKEEGIKFWLVVPLYNLIATIALIIVNNLWIILWYVFWFNALVLMVVYGAKSIMKQWEEYKNE